MKGFPKWLNSKADYLYVMENFPREQWIGKFQALLDEQFDWFNVGEAVGNGITDETHKVVVSENMGESKKYQYELRENPDCTMYRLGFTVDELEALLQGG